MLLALSAAEILQKLQHLPGNEVKYLWWKGRIFRESLEEEDPCRMHIKLI